MSEGDPICELGRYRVYQSLFPQERTFCAHNNFMLHEKIISCTLSTLRPQKTIGKSATIYQNLRRRRQQPQPRSSQPHRALLWEESYRVTFVSAFLSILLIPLLNEFPHPRLFLLQHLQPHCIIVAPSTFVPSFWAAKASALSWAEWSNLRR